LSKPPTDAPGGPGSKGATAPPDDAERLRIENEKLRQRVAELERENSALRKKVEALQQASFRQAAPFRLPEELRSPTPAKPGRAKGHPGSCRARPDHVDEEVEQKLSSCPSCGGPVGALKPLEQFIEDIPPIRPWVTRVVTYAGTCSKCGPVRSRHPAQVSEAIGAAATQLGPRAAALATDINKAFGLPVAKTCAVLREHFGLRITPGGLVHLEARLAARLRPTYQELLALIRRSQVVYADETSWWVGGPGYWLWVFTTPHFTFYVVDESRGQEVVAGVLGESFSGILTSDCLPAYDKIKCLKHKCYAHHLRAIAMALEGKAETEGDFLRKIRLVLKSAIAVGALRNELPKTRYDELVANIERWADQLLSADHADRDEQRVANRLRKQREHLFTFLKHGGVDATNNAAERALRPAVVARKISCGNRTPRGRDTWQTLASIAATCKLQRRSFASLLASTIPLGSPAPNLRPPPT
jgi:transposase